MRILERHWNTAISSPHPAESYCGIRALLVVARVFQSFRKQRVKNKKISDLNLLGHKKNLPWKQVSILFLLQHTGRLEKFPLNHYKLEERKILQHLSCHEISEIWEF